MWISVYKEIKYVLSNTISIVFCLNADITLVTKTLQGTSKLNSYVKIASAIFYHNNELSFKVTFPVTIYCKSSECYTMSVRDCGVILPQ